MVGVSSIPGLFSAWPLGGDRWEVITGCLDNSDTQQLHNIYCGSTFWDQQGSMWGPAAACPHTVLLGALWTTCSLMASSLKQDE